MDDLEVFNYELLIREHHLDSFGHVNNATYLAILEEARWEFITQYGFGLEEIHRRQQGPAILEFRVQFLKEIRLRQNIRIESQLISYVKRVGTLRQDIFNDAGEHCCHAEMVFGLFDLRTRRLIKPTEEWLKAIGLNTKII